MLIFLFFSLSLSIHNDKLPLNNFQYKVDEIQSFTNKRQNILIEMGNCLPEDIRVMINEIISVYRKDNHYNEDIINKSMVFLYHKIHNDLQINKPLCDIIKESINTFSKKITSLMTFNNFFKIDLDIQMIESKCQNFTSNTIKYNRFLNDFGSIRSNGMKCFENIKRNALFYALKEE